MATPPETIEQPFGDEAGPRFNAQRLALMIGGALAVFVLVWLLFLRGGGEELPPENLPALTTPSPEATEDIDDRDNDRVETFEVFAARDPFDPVVEAAGANGGDGDGTDGTDGDGDTDIGDGDGTIGTEIDGDGDGDDGGDRDSVGGHRVRVVDVFPRGRRAQVQVDGTVYTVDEGETFAENFQLVSASGQCATMLFGDDEFTLCEGEEILK